MFQHTYMYNKINKLPFQRYCMITLSINFIHLFNCYNFCSNRSSYKPPAVDGEATEESTAPQTPLWDSFEVKARAEYYDDADLWLNLRRVAKVLTIGVIFVLVLASGLCCALFVSHYTSS